MLMFSVRVWLCEIGLHASESEQACCLVQLLVLQFYSLRFSYIRISENLMHVAYACTHSGSPHNVIHSASLM